MGSECKLLILLGIEYTYSRSLLEGILEEIRRHPGVRIQLVRSEGELRRVVRYKERFTAVIGMIWSAPLVEELRQVAPYILSFTNKPPYPADRHVILKDREIGKTGAIEFVRLGLNRLGFLSRMQHFHTRERYAGFKEYCEQSGLSSPPAMGNPAEVVEWMRNGGGAVGILAENDVCAREFLTTCEEQGIEVPGAVSVMGVDDDDVYVHLGQRSLTSIHLPFKEMGRLAVQLSLHPSLSEIPELVELPPSHVVYRETTSAQANFPAMVRNYMEHLRRERPLPASVAAACTQLRLQRRSLEIACRKTLNKSPGELLHAERQTLARGMASDGADLQAIADELGFVQTRSLKRFLD